MIMDLSVALIVKVVESLETAAVPELTSETTGREKAGLITEEEKTKRSMAKI